MSKEVLPQPERLDGTRSCEMAALLATLGFEPVDRQMAIVTGDGVPGGRLGYWRFLPQHPRGRFALRVVLAQGLDVYAMQRTPRPDFPAAPAEQVYIAAVFHNMRLLTEQVTRGTRLRLRALAFPAQGLPAVYVFERVEARGVEEMADAATVREVMRAGTRRTELAAALATLGFEPCSAPAGEHGGRIEHEGGGVLWLFPQRSADGRWELQERMAHWADDAWCAREENNDPIACMADACWNLRHLRKTVRAAQRLVRVKNGDRTVLLSAAASDREWKRASDFLKGK